MPNKDEKKAEFNLYRYLKDSVITNQESLKVFGAASMARLMGGHPIDTMASRVKTSSQPIYHAALSRSENFKMLKQTLFQDSVKKNPLYKIRSLYQGIVPQTGNRLIQMVAMEAQRSAEHSLQNQYDFSKNQATATIALAFGGLNAFLVAYVNQKKISQQLKTKPTNCLYAVPPMWYRNTTWLLAKSSISYALENSYSLQRDAADFTACCLASGICLPFDRVKTMIQARKLERGTFKGLSHIIKKEGTLALWRGLPFEMALHSVGYALFYGTKHWLTEEKQSLSFKTNSNKS